LSIEDITAEIEDEADNEEDEDHDMQIDDPRRARSPPAKPAPVITAPHDSEDDNEGSDAMDVADETPEPGKISCQESARCVCF